MTQHAISRLESQGYGKPTLTTLKRLAAAMDVGLIVRFVPFSELVDWVSGTPRTNHGLTAAALAVTTYDQELSECDREESYFRGGVGGGAADLALPNPAVRKVSGQEAISSVFRPSSTAGAMREAA
jgi:hypothetical protein